MLAIVKVPYAPEPTADEIETREDEWIAMIEAGLAVYDEYLINGFVFSSAVQLPIGEDGAYKRVAMTARGQRLAAEVMGAYLLTKEQADLLLKNSNHIAPVITRPAAGGSPTSATLVAMIAASDHIDAQRKGIDGPYDNEGKFYLRGAKPGYAINYGLVDVPQSRRPNVPPMRPNGLHMYQDVGRTHVDTHVDATQTLRVVWPDENINAFEVWHDVPRSYLGERSEYARDWQRYLQQLSAHYNDSQLHPGKADGWHFSDTEKATAYFLSGSWSPDYEAPPTKDIEVVEESNLCPPSDPPPPPPSSGEQLPDTDPPPIDGEEDLGYAEFTQANSYHKGRRDSDHPIHCVIHVAQIAEVMHAAESLAKYADSETTKVSYHYAVDGDSAVQCVREEDTAWAAPGANHSGIQFELSGYAEQSTEEWHDVFSQNTIFRAAYLVARACVYWDIPIRKISVLELREGAPGICGHDDVTHAFGKSTHTDPGKAFPWKEFIACVQAHASDMYEQE